MSVPARHGEIERQRVLRAVEGLVVDLARLDPLDVARRIAFTPRSRNSDSVQTWLEDRKPCCPEHHPADAEIPQLVLIAQIDHVGQVAPPAGAIEPACGIPYGVPLWEIYLIFQRSAVRAMR